MKIGIANQNEYRERTIAIAKGDYKPAPDEPKYWFQSIKSAKSAIAQGKHNLYSSHVIQFVDIKGNPVSESESGQERDSGGQCLRAAMWFKAVLMLSIK